MKKQIISLLLALVMVASLVPAAVPEAYAADGHVRAAETDKPPYLVFYEGSGAVKTYDTELTEAVIPATIDGIAVRALDDQAFMYCRKLTSVTIPDSVTSIGTSAFDGCIMLPEVKIPDGVSYIGRGAFFDCSSLTDITIPDSVTYMGSEVFHGCTSLASATLSKNFTMIENETFRGCGSLSSVTIPDSVNYIGYASFQDCSSLTDVKLPQGVTAIGPNAFQGCSSLASITIPDSVDCIWDEAFRDCRSLVGVTIPEGVTSVRKGAFYGCSSIKEITIPNSIEAIGEAAFDGCTALKDVYFDGTAKEWEKIAVGDLNSCLQAANLHVKEEDPNQNVLKVFNDVNDNWSQEGIQYCYNHGLMSGTSDATFSPNGTMTRGMFAMVLWNQAEKPEPKGETPFTDFTKQYYQKAIAWAYENEVVNGITETTFRPDHPITREQVATILYRYAKNVLKMDVTASNDITGFLDYSNISNFAKVPLAWANAEGIISGSKDGGQLRLLPGKSATRAQGAKILMGFSHTRMAGPKKPAYLDLDPIMRSVHCNDKEITKAVIPVYIDGVPVQYLGESAFVYCKKLTSVTIPDTIVGIMEAAFRYCVNLTSVTIPKHVRVIDMEVFEGCKNLTSVTIPDDITSIYRYAFAGCESLTSLTIPAGVKSIEDGVFAGCSGLTHIEIPSGVKDIRWMTFRNCTGLTSVSIPASLTFIDDAAFRNCPALKNVNYEGTESQWNEINMGKDNDCLKNANIHYNVHSN